MLKKKSEIEDCKIKIQNKNTGSLIDLNFQFLLEYFLIICLNAEI